MPHTSKPRPTMKKGNQRSSNASHRIKYDDQPVGSTPCCSGDLTLKIDSYSHQFSHETRSYKNRSHYIHRRDRCHTYKLNKSEDIQDECDDSLKSLKRNDYHHQSKLIYRDRKQQTRLQAANSTRFFKVVSEGNIIHNENDDTQSTRSDSSTPSTPEKAAINSIVEKFATSVANIGPNSKLISLPMFLEAG